MPKHSPYVSPEQLKNLANNIIWADSSVCRYLSADEWKYGILVEGQRKMLSPNACKKTCIAEKNWATALNPLTKVTTGEGEEQAKTTMVVKGG